MLEMPKGTTREDGYRYWGSYNRKRVDGSRYICQTWLRPELYAGRMAKQGPRARKWYQTQRELQTDKYAKTKADNVRRIADLWAFEPKRAMVYIVKNRAKAKGLPFNLTPDDFEIPDVCPLLGISLQRGVGKATMNSPELDRLVPSLGYVKGNVKVISRRANSIKSDATLEEIQLVAKNLAKYLK